jgi:hypothetical protein
MQICALNLKQEDPSYIWHVVVNFVTIKKVLVIVSSTIVCAKMKSLVLHLELVATIALDPCVTVHQISMCVMSFVKLRLRVLEIFWIMNKITNWLIKYWICFPAVFVWYIYIFWVFNSKLTTTLIYFILLQKKITL